MIYRGVKLIEVKNDNRYPYTGQGIVWSFATIEDLKNYIDKGIDSGKMQVNDDGGLMFI